MKIKILPRETVLIAKNYQLLMDWYIDNLNFKIIYNNLDIKYCSLATDSGIKIGIADMESLGNENYSKRIQNTVILQIATNDLDILFKKIKNNHCYIRLSSNKVLNRAKVFLLGMLVLIAWWIIFLYNIL